MADYSYTLSTLEKYKGAKWTLIGNSYDGLQWHSDDISKPSQAELEEDYIECIRQNHHKEKRRAEYPPIEEQLDLMYERGYAGWKAEIKKIKDKYPKPE